MKRTPIVAGNWKMNKTVSEARKIVEEMLMELNGIGNVEKVICPPFPALMAVSALLAGSSIELGAQDLFWEASGAFTGEVSAVMIKEFCRYVIIGHSERRAYFGETNQTINKKVRTALSMDLIPILCIGETLIENEAGRTEEVIVKQVNEGLAGMDAVDVKDLVVAYEPVWAIGTGRAATGELANKVVKEMIRPALAALFGEAAAQATRVQYGGSVTGANAAEFFIQSDIDGALVGGASLKPNDFVQITRAAVG